MIGKYFWRCSTTSRSSLMPPPSRCRRGAAPTPASSSPRRGSRRRGDRPSAATAGSSGISTRQRFIVYEQRGLKRQPAGGLSKRRRLSRHLHEPLGLEVHARQRAEQAPRVRMARRRVDLADGRLLDHPARVHDDHVVGDLGDHPEVVRDHDDRRAVLLLQLAHQLEDLRLRRHVERRRRLVRDQQVGVVDERHRDHHALPHAAGELVRIVVDPLLGPRNADLLERVHAPGRAPPAWRCRCGAAPPPRAASRST